MSSDEFPFPYRLALRPEHDNPELLDDVVVKDVAMFRAELMDDDHLWMCCYFPGTDERITFAVLAVKRGKKAVLRVSYQERPIGDEFTYEPVAARISGGDS